MVDPMDVDTEPGQRDKDNIKDVVLFVLGSVASEHPRLRQFQRTVRSVLHFDASKQGVFMLTFRYPEIKYAAKMEQKSEVVVLGTHLDDPANRSGMKKVLKRLQPLVPVLDTSAGRCQKTLMIGDHGFSAMGRVNGHNVD